MAALAGPSVSVKTVLLTPDQPLLLQLLDQNRRIDDAACGIGAARQANDLAREFEQLPITALGRFRRRVQAAMSENLGAQVVPQPGNETLVQQQPRELASAIARQQEALVDGLRIGVLAQQIRAQARQERVCFQFVLV